MLVQMFSVTISKFTGVAYSTNYTIVRNLIFFICEVIIDFFLNFYFILLYNTVLVLPYIDMNLPRVYMNSQSWTPLPAPTPYHLSGSSPCTSPKHPVSCIKHRLAIHFLHDRTFVFSMPFSQIIPPSSSPTESKRLVYTSVSLLLSLIQGYHYHFVRNASGKQKNSFSLKEERLETICSNPAT